MKKGMPLETVRKLYYMLNGRTYRDELRGGPSKPVYTHVVLTGSAAIWYMLEQVKRWPRSILTRDDFDKADRFLTQIKPNDADFIVVGPHRVNGPAPYLPGQIDEYATDAKPGVRFARYESNTNTNTNTFDVLVEEGAVTYFEFNVYCTTGAIKILDFDQMLDNYRTNLGIEGRNKELDRIKIEAIEFLKPLFNMNCPFCPYYPTTSTNRDRAVTVNRQNRQNKRDASPVRPSIRDASCRKKLAF